MPQFRKKPVTIEAIQFSGTAYSAAEIEKWSDDRVVPLVYPDDITLNSRKLTIETLEGTMTANEGDWVIRGVKGEFYPCKDTIFRMTYQPIDTEECELSCGQ